MTKRTLLISIPAMAIALNGAGYLIVSKVREPSPTVIAIAPAAVLSADKTVQQTLNIERDDAEKDKEDTGRARRQAGLIALEAGDYDKALINFTVARALLGEKAHVGELLRVTAELRSRPLTPPPPPRTRGAGSSSKFSASRSVTRTSAAPLAGAREDAPAETSPVQAASPSGLLIVTTTPRGLLVHVDEMPIDLTPMRIRVKPGSRRIALLDGDRKVYETTLDIKDGATATLLKDLSTERVSEAPRPASVTTEAPPARDDSARALTPPPATVGATVGVGTTAPVTVAMSAPAKSAPAKSAPASVPALRPAAGPAPQPPAPSSGTGRLSVASPGLYGVVWINGRPRGYPPLEVSDLPVGPAKIEVRVNGIVRRSSTVVVKPDLTTAVKLRSQDSAP